MPVEEGETMPYVPLHHESSSMSAFYTVPSTIIDSASNSHFHLHLGMHMGIGTSLGGGMGVAMTIGSGLSNLIPATAASTHAVADSEWIPTPMQTPMPMPMPPSADSSSTGFGNALGTIGLGFGQCSVPGLFSLASSSSSSSSC
eukprot:ANDGO_02953.mRNA.1 hypothetical protein